MTLEQSQLSTQCQRVQVEMEQAGNGKRVKIRVENHDERLGWYISGSLSLPLHQLPLLEQALVQMRSNAAPADASVGQIVPFPGTRV